MSNENVEQPKTSRLPAGSTMLVGGVHVPHPHAAVNEPGMPDPRAGDTDAVTEEIVIDPESGEVNILQRPLDEQVRVASPLVSKPVDSVSVEPAGTADGEPVVS